MIALCMYGFCVYFMKFNLVKHCRRGRWAGYLVLAHLSMRTANSFVCSQVHVQESDQVASGNFEVS